MKKTKKALASLAIAGMVLSMAPASIFAADATVTRIEGVDRFDTSVKIAEKAYSSATTAIVAAGNDANLVDSLAAAPLAAQEKAPIYLTNVADKVDVEAGLLASLTKLGVTKVIAVGAAAKDANTVAALEKAGVTVEKVAGNDRIATAELINAKLTAVKGTIVVGLKGEADAMSVASFAAANGYKIVIADRNGVTTATKADYILGGPTMVKDIAGAVRIGGAVGTDRYDTNKDALAKLDFNYGTVYVANGKTLADALAASVYAAQTKSPILLFDPVAKNVEAAAAAGAEMTSASNVVALGGAAAVSEAGRTSVKYVAPATLAVESVSAINAGQVKVVFNKAVDKSTAEDLANYSIKAANSDGIDVNFSGAASGSNATLQSDKQTVVINLDGTYLNSLDGAKYLINVQDVTDTNGNKVTEYNEIVAMHDASVPQLSSVTMTDSQTVQFLFSEPVQASTSAFAGALTVKLDGTTKFIPSSAVSVITSSKTKDNYRKGFKINLAGLNLDTDKTYDVTVKGLTDFASNSMADYSGSFTYAKDSTDPTVQSVSVIDNKTLKLEFSEKVQIGTIKVSTVVGGTTYNATVANFSSSSPDGKTFVANFAGVAPGGAFSDGSSSLVTVSSFKDLAGNTQDTSYVTAATWTTSKPAFSSTAATIQKFNGKYYAVVTFDRDVVRGAGTVTGKYVDSKNVTIATGGWANDGVNLVDSNDLASLESNQVALLIDGLASGNFTATFVAGSVKDDFNNGISKTNVTFSNTSATTTKTVAGVWVNKNAGGTENSTLTSVDGTSRTTNNSTVYVQFSGDVDSSALDVSRYTVDGVQAFKTAIFDGSQSLVKLTLKDNAIATTGYKTFAVKGINGVTDKTIYKGAQGSVDYFTTQFTENVLPTVSTVKLTDLQHIQVVFSENITYSTPASDFTVRVNGVKQTGLTFALNSDTVVIKLGSAINVNDADKVTLSIPSTNGIVDTNGNAFDSLETNAVSVAYSDLQGSAVTKLNSAFAYVDVTGATPTYAKLPSVTVSAFNKAVSDAKNALNAAGLTQDTVGGPYAIPGSASKTMTYKAALETLAASADAAAITVGYDGVAATLTLPTTTTNGSTVAWTKKTDATGVAALVGNVATITRSAADDTDDTVVFTATTTNGGTTRTDDFTITVKESKSPVATVPGTTGATNDGTKLVISLDEAIYVDGVALANGDVKSLFAYDGTAANYTSATYDAAAKTVTLVFTAAEDGKKITVSTTIKDAKGNAISATAFTYATTGTIWN